MSYGTYSYGTNVYMGTLFTPKEWQQRNTETFTFSDTTKSFAIGKLLTGSVGSEALLSSDLIVGLYLFPTTTITVTPAQSSVGFQMRTTQTITTLITDAEYVNKVLSFTITATPQTSTQFKRLVGKNIPFSITTLETTKAVIRMTKALPFSINLLFLTTYGSGYTLSLALAMSLLESKSIVLQYLISDLESIGMSVSILELLNLYYSDTETIGISITAPTTMYGLVVSKSDSFNISISDIRNIFKNITWSIITSELIKKDIGFIDLESISVSEIIKLYELKILSDSFALNETYSKLSSYYINNAITIALSESKTTLAQYIINESETISTLISLSELVDFRRLISDSFLTLITTPTNLVTANVLKTETISLALVLNTVTEYIKALTLSILLSETKSIINLFLVLRTELFNALISIATTTLFTKTFTNTASVTISSPTTLAGLLVLKTETFSLTDSKTTVLQYIYNLLNEFYLTDSKSILSAFYLNNADVTNITDISAETTGYNRSLTSTASITISAPTTLNGMFVLKNEQVTITESNIKILGKLLAALVTMIENLSKLIGTILSAQAFSVLELMKIDNLKFILASFSLLDSKTTLLSFIKENLENINLTFLEAKNALVVKTNLILFTDNVSPTGVTTYLESDGFSVNELMQTIDVGKYITDLLNTDLSIAFDIVKILNATTNLLAEINLGNTLTQTITTDITLTEELLKLITLVNNTNITFSENFSSVNRLLQTLNLSFNVLELKTTISEFVRSHNIDMLIEEHIVGDRNQTFSFNVTLLENIYKSNDKILSDGIETLSLFSDLNLIMNKLLSTSIIFSELFNTTYRKEILDTVITLESQKQEYNKNLIDQLSALLTMQATRIYGLADNMSISETYLQNLDYGLQITNVIGFLENVNKESEYYVSLINSLSLTESLTFGSGNMLSLNDQTTVTELLTKSYEMYKNDINTLTLSLIYEQDSYLSLIENILLIENKETTTLFYKDLTESTIIDADMLNDRLLDLYDSVLLREGYVFSHQRPTGKYKTYVETMNKHKTTLRSLKNKTYLFGKQ